MPLKCVNSRPASFAFSVNHSDGAAVAAGGEAALHPAKKKNARHAARALRFEIGRLKPATTVFNLVVALPQVSVEHFFRELHALELEELEVLLEMLVEHEVDLPGP